MTTNNEMSDPTPHMTDSTNFAEFLDIDHTILKKIVNGSAWMQIKGKLRDHKVLVPLVNNMEGGTLGGVLEHPDFQIMVKTLKTSELEDLTKTKKQGVDVLATFVQTYTKEEDIQLAKRVRNWAMYMARQLVLNETHPFANSLEQKFVEDAQSDYLFWKNYNFKSWMKDWKHPVRRDPSSLVKLISIDSEKVYCKGDGRGFFCVARLCVVGSDYRTLIDEFVKPAAMVTNYYTHIHGITEEDLHTATLTQVDAQALVMDLVRTPGTILVGHSLFNDLKVLQIDYKRVIDTAMLFSKHRKNANELYSLKDLCEKVLGYKLREEGKPHDCLLDAIAPMKLVHHLLRMMGSDD